MLLTNEIVNKISYFCKKNSMLEVVQKKKKKSFESLVRFMVTCY